MILATVYVVTRRLWVPKTLSPTMSCSFRGTM
jgi:hypothetical protein